MLAQIHAIKPSTRSAQRTPCMTHPWRWLLLIVFAVSLLPGCAWFEEPIAAPVPKEVVVPKRDVIAEIRAEAAKAGDVLTIVPVQNPSITTIFEKIEAADRRGEHFEARELTVEARIIEPENPLVLQYTAEAMFRNENYLEAEMMARKSFEQSAQLGPLCVRNWLLIAEIKLLQRKPDDEAAARKSAGSCPLKPLQRL
jgi:hypothetical protein